MYYLCIAKTKNGTLADRLGNGLQNRVEQFDSARYLRIRNHINMIPYFFVEFIVLLIILGSM